MIKKLLSIAVLLTSLAANAQEKITVQWAFSPSSTSANSVRVICDELNKMQNKYTFLFSNKPGAGGTIAANAVTASPENTLVAMSSSFIVRPYFEKTEPTHNLDNFVPVLVQGIGSPLSIASAKHTTMAEVYANPKLTIGVSGVGSIGHLTANEITNVNKTATIANFKSNIEAATAVAGGHVDISVTFASDVAPFVESNKLAVLGRTGPGTQLKQIPDAEKLAANYAIFASTAMSADRFKELHQLLATVNASPAVVNSYKSDQLHPVALNIDQSRAWYTNERAFWKKQVDKISKTK
jgi:tripartite-type tricarboxylate transporter receptor subunit TctC